MRQEGGSPGPMGLSCAEIRLRGKAGVRLLLVFNPQAAFGRARRLLGQIRSALGDFAAVDTVQTAGPGDAMRRVAETNVAEFDGVVAAGGDGTLFEVLNGLYRHEPPRRVPLGLLPVGTGNAFARDLGLRPGDWGKAIELIRAGHRRRVDVGRVDVEPGGSAQRTFHFLNIIGAGLPVDAMRAAERIKLVGRSAYSLATLWRAMMLRSYAFSIELDGDPMEQDALFVEVSNTRYTGTHFLIAPDARLDDGLLDVTLVRPMRRARLLRLFPTIYSGEHIRYEEVLTRQVRSIRIRSPAGMALAPDGEIYGQTPARISCLPRDLEIFA
jgi:diacylglycerol kinase (ATP)